MSTPLVSICIPTFNGAKYLAAALQSAEQQTYPNIEIIISDDGSTDGTLELCDAFRETTKIPVRLYRHEPAGIGANWDHSIEKSNGDYIKFLFQDDLLEPDCIAEMMKIIHREQLDIVVCKRKIIDEHGKPLSADWVKRFGDLQQSFGLMINEFYRFSQKDLYLIGRMQPAHFNFIGEPVTALFSKKLYQSTGGFDSPLKQFLDLEYWLKTLKKFEIGIIPEKLISFRVHELQSSNTNNRHRTVDEQYYIEKMLLGKYFFKLSRRMQKKLLLKYIKRVLRNKP